MELLVSLAARVAALSPAELAVTRVAFHGILAGRPVGEIDLPAATSLSAEAVRVAVDALVGRGSLTTDAASGAIVAARGLSLRPTPHRLALAGRREPLFASCAVDAVGIPAALGADGTVTSRCHHCAAPVGLTARGGAIAVPPGVVIWAVDDDGRGSVREFT